MKTFKQFYEATGAETHWQDGDVNITLNDVLDQSSDPVSADPSMFKQLLINVSRDSNRIAAADLRFPIIVTIINGKPEKILDGQHRVVKAMKLNQPIQVQYLDLDRAPEQFKQMFT
tara:strand:+ start:1689 stop:2036 length:348 start_codon:yes stop_codon:yes gene_type:complete